MSEDRLRAAIALYDRFTHTGMDRRLFMTELTRIAGGAAAASLMLSSIAACAQAPPHVAADDPRIFTDTVQLGTGDNWVVSCYRAAPLSVRERRPPEPAQPPIIIVIHENRGLNEHIRDVARRLAVAGYRVLAPDFLSIGGGPGGRPGGATPANEDEARAAISALDLDHAAAIGAGLIRRQHEPQHIIRPFDRHPNAIGVVGFCWGGGMVHRLAIAAGDALGAAVSFYGPAPDPALAARVVAPELVILAGRDQRVNATARPWAEALRAAGRTVEVREFPDVDHAFHNDTAAARYNAQAARQAWTATIDFFRQHLRDPTAAS